MKTETQKPEVPETIKKQDRANVVIKFTPDGLRACLFLQMQNRVKQKLLKQSEKVQT